MCYEKTSPSNLRDAFESYCEALPLISSVQLSTIGSPRTPLETSFNNTREFWRWSERLLFRAILISSRTESRTETLNLLRQHRSSIAQLPTSFRFSHRSVVLSLHMRALISHPSSLATSSEIESVAQDYRGLLAAITHFPRAGYRNAKVEDFVDLCVAAWDVSGSRSEQAGWVIDV